MNRVYSFTDERVIAAGASGLQGFDLMNIEPNKKIISILWELKVNHNVTNCRIPLEQLSTIDYFLNINNAPLTMSDVFQNFTNLGGLLFNGTGFNIHTPNRQIIFKSFAIQNILNFTISLTNYDALIAFKFYNTILVETE
jgi:hypothetical protein